MATRARGLKRNRGSNAGAQGVASPAGPGLWRWHTEVGGTSGPLSQEEEEVGGLFGRSIWLLAPQSPYFKPLN